MQCDLLLLFILAHCENPAWLVLEQNCFYFLQDSLTIAYTVAATSTAADALYQIRHISQNRNGTVLVQKLQLRSSML